TLTDYVGTQGGLIQVDGNKDGEGTAAGNSTLDLQHTTIDGGSNNGVTSAAVFNIDGLLRVDGTAGNSTIENFTSFTSDGELLVTAGVTLTLLNDTLTDYVGAQGGLIVVDGLGNGTGTGSVLELQSTTINGGGAITHPAVLNVKGLLEADSATLNTIENFTAGNFTNDGELLVTAGATLTLLNDTLTD